MGLWKSIFATIGGTGETISSGKPGARAYAIGDIHGRLDLLDDIIGRIEADIAARERRKTFIVFLGDLIDRGPDSAGVVERLRNYRPEYARPIFLAGNHEEVLLTILEGQPKILPSWLEFGGAECAASYGIDPGLLRRLDERRAIALLRDKIPRSHTEFLAGFGDTFRFGDYLFVHAGIRPGLSLEDQDRKDLRWIREPFLSEAADHGFIVVHGHTIVDQVEERRNRIGLDTGAYRSGILTALAIEEEERWYLQSNRVHAHSDRSARCGAAA